MNVQYYTYKVEFQERGAGHIHGTLWLNLNKLEKLTRSINGDLINVENYNQESIETMPSRPFENISSAFKKLKDNDDLSKREMESLRNFVDEFTTVSTNKEKVGKKVAEIVLEVNRHCHTKSCRKYDTSCRFLFPRYPSVRTIIAKPISGINDTEKAVKLKKYNETLKKVGTVLVDDDAIEEIIKEIGNSENEPYHIYKINKKRRIEMLLDKAETSLQEYEEALSYTKNGYKVVLERDITEIFINTYNIEWIRTWNGNMDMSPCFDYHAVITYISDYFSKDDRGLMELIKSVLQHTSTDTVKEQMKLIANTFLTHRQIGEAEAIYRLLPNMILKNSNVGCQWLSIGKRAELSKRWRQATKEEIESSEGLIRIKDREGYWVEQNDMLSKYLRRPESLELISASQFSKMYTTSGLKLKKMDFDVEDIHDERIEDENIDILENKLDYMITGTHNGFKLPMIILIQNPSPGEPKWMRKRTTPAVLRYHKSNKDNQFERWMLKELMLYTPFRIQDLEDYETKTAEIYEKKRIWIQTVKSKVMEHLESVEEARYMVEQSTKEIDLENVGIELNATHMQDQDDCLYEGLQEHPDYVHLDTDGLSHYDNDKSATSIFKNIEVPDKKHLRQETRNLDEFQMEVLNMTIKYAKDVVKARRMGNKSPNPIYIIGHGGAGAGKSTVINIVTKWCHTILAQHGDDHGYPYIIKTAFTGTAASNIDGQTLHTSFGFNFDNKHYSLNDKSRDEKRTLFKNLRIIIIDEISMVKADMIYQLDLKLQEIKERMGIPFGGVSILAFGDLLQLRPVLGAFPFEKPKNPEFQATFELHDRWKMFKVLNLNINHRQGNDKQYAETLNRIRVGKLTEEDIAILKTRERPINHPDLKNVSLYIIPTRKSCAKYNKKYLEKLTGTEIVLQAIHYHSTQKKYTPFIDKKEGAVGTTSFLDKVQVKIGCQIILIHNVDVEDGLTNGQLGKLVKIIFTKEGKPDKLIVELQKKDAGIRNRKKFADLAKTFPNCVILERVSINYSIRKKGGIIGSTATLIQFPVKLAYAITAHKIQGQTILKPLIVAFDIEAIFEEAQGYVMLSRVQELSQAFIIGELNPAKLYPSAKALKELERMNSISVNENPTPWNQKLDNAIRVLFLNCAGLKHHYDDIKVDKKIQKSDIFHLLEISLLESDDEEEYSLYGYNNKIQKVGNGKGIGTYFKDESFSINEVITTDKFQIGSYKNDTLNLDVLCLYRSQIGSSSKVLEDIQRLLNDSRRTLVVGDFNICYDENFRNPLIQGLLAAGFQQLVHEPTHLGGRKIDHAYIRDPTKRLKLFVDRYSPYYSDHDAISITLIEPKSTPLE